MPIGRLEALTDGVIAIVVTLLILLIQPPEAGMSKDRLHEVLFEDWHMFIAYLVSFILLCLYWWRHHILFHYLKRADGVLTILNLVFLLCVALVPFPTALLIEYFKTPEIEIAVLIFGIVNIACTASLLAMWKYATGNQNLVRKSLDDLTARRMVESIYIFPIVYLPAMILSFFSPAIALFFFFLVPVLHLIPRYWVTHEVIMEAA